MEIRPDAIDRSDADNALFLFTPEATPPVECLHPAHPRVAEPGEIHRPGRRNRARGATRVLRAAAFASGLMAGALIALVSPVGQSEELEAESMSNDPNTTESLAVVTPVIVVSEPTRSMTVQSPRRRPPPTRAVPLSTKDGPSRGELVVASQPQGAAVFINNTYAGETPLTVPAMDIGSRAVRVRLDGYEPWSRGIRIVANESTTVTADLIPSKPPQ